jgi:MFS family permease
VATRTPDSVMTVSRTQALATAAVFALNASLIAAWISRLPATRDRLDAGPRTLGLVLLALGLGSLVAMPLVGRVASRFGSKPVVVGTAAFAGLALIAASAAPGVVPTAIALFALGTAYGSWDVAMNIQGSFVDRSLGRDYMPRYHACWSVGLGIGTAFGALAARMSLSLPLHFSIAAVVASGGAIAVAVRWFVDDREQHPEPELVLVEDGSMQPVARTRLLTRRIVLIGVITLCGTLLEGSAADWLTLFLTDDRDLAASTAALGYAVFAVFMAASRFAGTPVIARLGRSRAVGIAGVLAALGVAATLSLPSLPGILVGVAFWAIGTSLVFPSAMSAGGEQPGRAADAIAAVSTIGYGGFLIGPPLIGVLAQQIGIGHALWILPALGIGVALLAWVVAPPHLPEP